MLWYNAICFAGIFSVQFGNNYNVCPENLGIYWDYVLINIMDKKQNGGGQPHGHVTGGDWYLVLLKNQSS